MMPNTIFDVVVVGAGLAGLATAKQLDSHGLSSVVLEARSRIGGRVHSVVLPDGNVADLGAQLIGPNQSRVQALVAAAGATLASVEVKGRRVREPRLKLSITDRLSLVKLAVSLHRLSRKIPIDSPWLHPRADYLDSISVAHWFHSQGTSAAATVWCNITAGSFCINPDNISMLEGLHHLATMGGVTGLASAETHYLEKGTGVLTDYLAKTLDIRLNTEATKIRLTDALVVVETNADQFQARQVVLAVPPQLGIKILSTEDAQKIGYIQSATPASVVKTVLVYDTPWWRDAGYSGFASCATGPVNELFDFNNKKTNTSTESTHGILTALSTADTVRTLPADESERNHLIANHIGTLFNNSDQTPIFIHSTNWSDEAFSLGGYASVRSPGSWIKHGQLATQQTGAIYAAGTETASQWRSYMEGALASAEDVVLNILKNSQLNSIQRT